MKSLLNTQICLFVSEATDTLKRQEKTNFGSELFSEMSSN